MSQLYTYLNPLPPTTSTVFIGSTDTPAGNNDEELNKLYQALNDFNKGYQLYVENGCNDVITANTDPCKRLHNPSATIISGQPYVGSNLGTLDICYNYIQTNAKNFNHPSIDVTSIQSKHKNVLETRAKLDEKMKEVYNTQDSMGNLYKQRFDSTMYTGILLSALAASLLFYVFKEL